MPLLKFICKNCNHIFEELTTADKLPPCPKCESTDVSRHYQGKCNFGGHGGGGNCSDGSCCCCKS